MYPEQLEWLADHARSRYRILELGVWRGKTTDVLSRATDGTVYAVDSWMLSDDHGDSTSTEDPAEACVEFMSGVGCRGNVVTYAMTSVEAYERTGHLTFDMVWIDGDHRYEAVRQDISMWRSRLSPGGLLCGHDGEYESVGQAVAELVPRAKFHATPQPEPYTHRASLIWYDDGIQ